MRRGTGAIVRQVQSEDILKVFLQAKRDCDRRVVLASSAFPRVASSWPFLVLRGPHRRSLGTEEPVVIDLYVVDAILVEDKTFWRLDKEVLSVDRRICQLEHANHDVRHHRAIV